MKKSKALRGLLALAALTTTFHAQAGFISILDGVMANINKHAGLVGPIYKHDSKSQDNYGDQIAEVIIKEAHKIADREFLRKGNTQAYYGFMAAALTVPNQEGLLVHFREVPARRKYCNDRRSTGKGIEGRTARQQFQAALNDQKLRRDPENGFLVECKALRGERTYRQLIVGGSDGSDVGIMQLSARWNYDPFLTEFKVASVSSTVEYGLKYLLKGYKKAFRGDSSLEEKLTDAGLDSTKDGKIDCMYTNGQLDYKKLVRGSWSAYNGGPNSICRFSDSDSAYKGHDAGFEKNLNRTLALNNGGNFGFDDDEGLLPLTPKYKEALAEIISNFENKTNNRAKLDSLL